MITTKKVLSATGTILLICGFIVFVGAPAQVEVPNTTMLDALEQLIIGMGAGAVGLFMRALAK